MILSTLHKTLVLLMTYLAIGTLDFFPPHKSENALCLPSRPLIFTGVYPKTTVQGWSYENISGSNLP